MEGNTKGVFIACNNFINEVDITKISICEIWKWANDDVYKLLL